MSWQDEFRRDDAYQAVCLVGVAGIGKSWRSRLWLRELPGQHIKLRAGVGVTSLLGALKSQILGLTGGGEESVSTLKHFLSRCAPCVLVVDHLHEAEGEEQRFWECLASSLAGVRGVRLLGLSRTAPPRGWEAVEVRPLDEQESNQLVREMLGHPPPAGLCHWVWGRAQGSPLLTLELLRHLERTGALVRRGRWAQWAAPSQVQLPPPLCAPLRTLLADVQDRDGRLALLTSVLGGDRLAHPMLESLVWQQWPADELSETLRPLLCSKDWNAPPLTELALVHQRLLLCPQERFRLLHLGAQQAQEPAQVAELWKALSHVCEHAELNFPADGYLAWARALGHVQPQEASALLKRFTATCGHPLMLDEWQLRLELAVRAGMDAPALLQEAAAPWRPPLTQWLRAEQVREAGRQRDAQRVLELMEGVERADCPPDLLNVLGLALHDLGCMEEAQATLKQALGRALAPGQRSRALQLLSLFPLYEGRDAEASERLTLALAELPSDLLTEEAQSVRADSLILWGMLRERQGLLAGAAEAFEHAAQAYLDAGLPGRYVVALGYLSGVQREQGDFDQAHETVQQAWLLRSAAPLRASVVLLMNAVVLYFAWNDERAPAYLQDAVQELQTVVTDTPELQASLYIALGLGAAGQAQAALETLPPLLEEASSTSPLLLDLGLWVRSFCCWQRGDQAAALEAVAQASQQAQERESDKSVLLYRGWEAIYRGDVAALKLTLHDLERRELRGYAAELRRWAAGMRPLPVASPQLRLSVLGRVQISGGQSGTPSLPRQTGRLLSQLLAIELLGREEYRLEALAELLFPTAAAPTERLGRLLTKVRHQLGEQALERRGEYVRLGDCESDAALFLQHGHLTLWRGLPFAGQADTPEMVEASALLLEQLAQAVRQSLDTAPQDALRAAALLRDADPYDAQAARLLLQAGSELGLSVRRMQTLYRPIQADFLEMGEQLPDKWQEWLGSPVAVQSELPQHRSTRWRQLTGRISTPQQPGRPRALTDEQLETLHATLKHPPSEVGFTRAAWTLRLASEFVTQQFGVCLSVSQLSRLLRKRALQNAD